MKIENDNSSWEDDVDYNEIWDSIAASEEEYDFYDYASNNDAFLYDSTF